MFGTALVLLAVVCSSHGSGMLCRSCRDATNPQACTSWERCGLDEECFTRAYMDANGRTAYRLGCEQKAICRLATSSLFGRRSSDGASCFSCCQYRDGCNTGLCQGAMTTDATRPIYPTGTRFYTNSWYSTTMQPWFTRSDSTPDWYQYTKTIKPWYATSQPWSTPYWFQYTSTSRPWSTPYWFQYTSTMKPWTTAEWYTSTMKPWSTPDWYQYTSTSRPWTTPYWYQYTSTMRPWSTPYWFQYTSTMKPWSTPAWYTSTMKPWSTPDWYQYFTTKLPYQEKQ